MNNILGLFPDSFWCGSGTLWGMFILGPNYLTDDCCWDHDLCKIFIEPGDTGYGLRNNGAYTMVNCKCDMSFYMFTFSQLSAIIGSRSSIFNKLSYMSSNPRIRVTA